MKSLLRFACCVLALLTAVSCAVEERPPDIGEDTGRVVAFINVNVIPMDTELVVENQTVVIADGRIVSVEDTENVNVPSGAIRIEAAGQYLIPALNDMHVHLEGDAW
ncbi:MAG: hypothetical protein IFK93_13305, partial [Acidobacteria bacterium]|nr:hypothetical protein [Candidatus Sulfomarinibacter kjeldsenii]